MAVKNSLQQKQPAKVPFGAYMTTEGAKANINKIIGGKNGPRFTSAIISAVNANPTLQECSNQSILSAALLGETLKLSPSPQLGHYYMVPFNKKDGDKTAQFILGYKGYIQLALRSGQYRKLNVLSIKEGELIRYDPLNEEIEVKLIEDEGERENAPTVGYYAFFEYLNGFRKSIYWSREKMLAHADRYSQAFSKDGGNFGPGGKFHRVSFDDYVARKYNPKDEWMYSSFWYKDFDAMAYKTMLRQLISKWGVMSIDMVTAFDADNTIEAPDGTRTYVELSDPAIAKLPEPEPESVAETAAEPEPPVNAPEEQSPVEENNLVW